ncbi:hypothetical protein AB4Z10_13025 [Bosea sp. RAF48]|uniref:hypothetical protein n=1 Tax=Bosea sp. RAF48 TaxID=3237480 RepID=UPI003F9281B7
MRRVRKGDAKPRFMMPLPRRLAELPVRRVMLAAAFWLGLVLTFFATLFSASWTDVATAAKVAGT